MSEALLGLDVYYFVDHEDGAMCGLALRAGSRVGSVGVGLPAGQVRSIRLFVRRGVGAAWRVDEETGMVYPGQRALAMGTVCMLLPSAAANGTAQRAIGVELFSDGRVQLRLRYKVNDALQTEQLLVDPIRG